MSAAARALRVLEHLVVTATPVSNQELARTLDIPRSTLSDLMGELRALGYVQQMGGHYVPGVALTLLGSRISQRLGAPPTIAHTLRVLAERTGETAIYAVEIGRDGERFGEVLIVEQVPSPNPIRYVASTSHTRSMRDTAAGRTILAFSGRDGHAEPALASELAHIRRHGYAVNVAESGATSIAIPARDAQGRLVGAMSVTGPSDRMHDAATRIWPILRETAASMQHA